MDAPWFWTWHEILCSFYITQLYDTKNKHLDSFYWRYEKYLHCGCSIYLPVRNRHMIFYSDQKNYTDQASTTSYRFYYRLITFDIFIAYSHVRVLLCCSHISFNVPFNNKILRRKKVKVLLSYKTFYAKSKV